VCGLLHDSISISRLFKYLMLNHQTFRQNLQEENKEQNAK
jgi:hypothetical protein